jgi:hypothetical protein
MSPSAATTSSVLAIGKNGSKDSEDNSRARRELSVIDESGAVDSRDGDESEAGSVYLGAEAGPGPGAEAGATVDSGLSPPDEPEQIAEVADSSAEQVGDSEDYASDHERGDNLSPTKDLEALRLEEDDPAAHSDRNS